MNSDIDNSFQDIIDQALLDPAAKKIERSYGQLGFLETEVVSNIFSAIQDKVSNSTFLEILQESRITHVAENTKVKITDLHTVTHNCRKCDFHSSITPLLPKWNVNDPDVVFIVDSSALDQQVSAVFVSALKTAGFTSEKVCLTYLLRCPTKSIEEHYINNCSQYLHTEIQIMNPKLICTIGSNSLSALFGTETKIKDYKSQITWLGSWPILPLYSLNYILKAGETALQSFQSDMNQAYHFVYKKAQKHDTD